jgi:hypothetical protein
MTCEPAYAAFGISGVLALIAIVGLFVELREWWRTRDRVGG